ncbi:hypothetical protein PHET_12033 [Paragonimus heterotremus]|uniref:Uncharacterized protein n=1 Tax=Paragonimus heterotremus TaxID=100268 RepID=A0A8J4WDC1_9TREM|nr:hypothetical protein PHET_12033 [Paragonimus heterotremus]
MFPTTRNDRSHVCVSHNLEIGCLMARRWKKREGTCLIKRLLHY